MLARCKSTVSLGSDDFNCWNTNAVIYATLSVNSTTFYTYENYHLLHALNNLNCSEIVSQELGSINVSKTLVGSIPIATSPRVNNSPLSLYFLKKTIHNEDGSNDLATIIVIGHVSVNQTLVLSIMKKIMDKYVEFSSDNSSLTQTDKARLGEFKLYMNQIIKFEEMNYDSNLRVYNYGSIEYRDEEAAGGEVIGPNQLVLACEETEEVRKLMLDNINKIMHRGDKINSLVSQTDRLTNSSAVFQRRSQQIRRKMWLQNKKLWLAVGGALGLIVYLVAGYNCGMGLSHCF